MKPPHPSVVVVGSLNADLVSRVHRLPRPGETVSVAEFACHCGGKGGNQACAVARLGESVAMIGCVGGDAYGMQLRDSLESAGVDVSAVDVVPGSSGIALVTVDDSGENQIVVVPGANAELTPERLERHRALLSSATLVLLQLEVPLETVGAAARLAREADATVILDPAPARPLAPGLLASASFVTPNESELAALTRDMPATSSIEDRAHALLARGAGHVIAKLGEEGARLFSRGVELHWPARPTTAVDTTAAGDAFNGALAVALARGLSIEAAGTFACTVASVSVSRPGAQPSMPSLDEVLAILPEPLARRLRQSQSM